MPDGSMCFFMTQFLLLYVGVFVEESKYTMAQRVKVYSVTLSERNQLIPDQECPPTTIRIILRFSTIKRQNCHNRFRRQNFVAFVGSGG